MTVILAACWEFHPFASPIKQNYEYPDEAAAKLLAAAAAGAAAAAAAAATAAQMLELQPVLDAI